MRGLIISAVILSAAASAPAWGSDQKSRAAKEDRMVCRTVTTTGTRFEKRVCKADSEWTKAAEAHNDAYREQVNRPVINRQGESPNGVG